MPRLYHRSHDNQSRSHRGSPFRTAVVCLIELLLREGREQQSQSLDLFRIENAVEEVVEVINRDQFSFLKRRPDQNATLGG